MCTYIVLQLYIEDSCVCTRTMSVSSAAESPGISTTKFSILVHVSNLVSNVLVHVLLNLVLLPYLGSIYNTNLVHSIHVYRF